jgi:4-hydroxy 2-oxovalerate aldolase
LILDCTLRDGGYYNAWDFDRDLIDAYLKAMVALPVDIVEIGFRRMPGAGGRFNGGNAYCTDDYVRSLNIPNNGFGVAVMVNGADLRNYTDGLKPAVDRLFGPAEESPVALVRIACHVHQVEETLPAIIRLHELGYRTTVQLMQIAGLSREEIMRLAKACSSYPLDVVYFADSLGSMVPEDINHTVDALRTYWKGELGFHAHNNMQGAVANCIQAIEKGVTWIDGTVTGMGRGPGNAPTEYLAVELETRLGREANHIPLLDLINRYFIPLKQRYGWGPNPYYYMAGKYGIHPTYVQTMIDDSRFQNEDMLAVIGYLKNVGGRHYNLRNLEAARYFYSGPAKGQWNPAYLVQDKSVLILGTGPGAVKYRNALESYIKRNNPIVIALNKQTPVNQELIDIRAACHPIRLLADHEDHLKLPQPLIIPCSMLPEDVITLYKGKEILDYGLTVQENSFEFHPFYCVSPNALVITYVLALLASGKAERIYMAGFDGYGPGDQRTMEMDKMLSLYMLHNKSLPILSVTPSKYKIPQTSIFDLNA